MSEEKATCQCSLSAQDLRIGNWVYDGERTQFPMQVVAIGKDWVHLDFPSNEGGVWEADIKDLRAIPITTEMLNKVGYERRSGWGGILCYRNKGLRIDAYETSKGWWVHIDDEKAITIYSKNTNYLHQLQNAYYMATGDELEVQT
jgi:hypothetical protein